MRTLIALPTLLAFTLLTAPVSGAEPVELTDAVPEIVARSIAFHGGDQFEHSESRFRLCSGSGCTDVRVRRDGGLYDHKVTGQIGGKRRTVRATNTSIEAWVVPPEGSAAPVMIDPIPAADEQRWRDQVTARVYHAFLPYRLSDPSVRFADLGPERWGDRTLHRVAVGFEAGTSSADYDRWVFWFDPETARLEQFAYTYRGNPDGLRFRQLHNFRRVDGLLFADQTNLGWEGPGLGVQDLDADSMARLRHVSDVELHDLSVKPYRAAATP